MVLVIALTVVEVLQLQALTLDGATAEVGELDRHYTGDTARVQQKIDVIQHDLGCDNVAACLRQLDEQGRSNGPVAAALRGFAQQLTQLTKAYEQTSPGLQRQVDVDKRRDA